MHRALLTALTLALGLLLSALGLLPAEFGLSPAAFANSRQPPPHSVPVTLLAINDFHGALEPPVGGTGEIQGVPAGGVQYLATHIKQVAAAKPNSLIVGAGDLIGASPLISSYFNDRPAIEALNALGLSLTAVGNHEFDRGKVSFLDLLRGHCDGACFGLCGVKCSDSTFEGAHFTYLGANVVDTTSQQPSLSPYTIKTIGGVRIGFIGETLRGTPLVSVPHSTQGIEFLEEAQTANHYAAELKRQGVNAIVLLLHEGGRQAVDGGPNGCSNFVGPITDIVPRLSDNIDVVLSAHTHQYYVCQLGSKLVTSASSYGRVFTEVNLEIDPMAGTIVSKRATNHVVTRDVAPDPVQDALVTRYRNLIAPIANRVVGSVTADIKHDENNSGESALGNLIADANLAATSDPHNGGSVIAMINMAGIRSDLLVNRTRAGFQRGEVPYGELFTLEPFGNRLVTMLLTGEQIYRALEQQFQGERYVGLSVSNGFGYEYRKSAQAGDHVVAGSVKLHGQPIELTKLYPVTVNNFLAPGGLNFSVFKEGLNQVTRVHDLDALVNYFEANSPLSPPKLDRVTMHD